MPLSVFTGEAAVAAALDVDDDENEDEDEDEDEDDASTSCEPLNSRTMCCTQRRFGWSAL